MIGSFFEYYLKGTLSKCLHSGLSECLTAIQRTLFANRPHRTFKIKEPIKSAQHDKKFSGLQPSRFLLFR